MNRRELVEQANLTYTGIVSRSEDGLPIGNGRMATLLWHSPASLKMQVNRADVYGSGNATNNFPGPRFDYGFGCAYVDIDCAGYGDDVFDSQTAQELNVYDATVRMLSGGVEIHGFADALHDAFVFRLEDRREEPQPIEIRLRMLRNSVVRRMGHVAESTLRRIGEAMVLRQEFTEEDYTCASTVAVQVKGRPFRVRMDNECNGAHDVLPRPKGEDLGREEETQMRFLLPPQRGTVEIVITSGASGTLGEAICDEAVGTGRALLTQGFEETCRQHGEWWHEFWERSFIRLWGTPQAEKLTMYYIYYIYITACCSRGSNYPPTALGMLFRTRGDRSQWNHMHWWNNVSLIYYAVLPSGHLELMEPFLNMYYNMYDECRTAAWQVWGAEGIWIGETNHAQGPCALPEDIAAELRALLTLKKPWDQRSERFKAFANKKNPYESRWNFLIGKVVPDNPSWENGELVYKESEYGPFSYVTHMFSGMGVIAYLFWLAYEYTMDGEFLRQRAYPMLRGTADFFATHPLLVKEEDGKYHFLYSSFYESFWGSKDALSTMAAIMGTLPIAIRAANMLDMDADRVAVWREVLENLAPLPTTQDTTAEVPRPTDGRVAWVGARNKPLCRSFDIVKTDPCVFYDLCNLETEHVNPALFKIGLDTLSFNLEHTAANQWSQSAETSPYPRIFANMGRGDILYDALEKQVDAWNGENEFVNFKGNGSKVVYENRMSAREGVNAITAQRLGNAAAGLQLGLLQSAAGEPGGQVVTRVFPAWNAEGGMNGEFTLWARGGVQVSSRCTGGRVDYVRILATRETEFILVNPWKAAAVAPGENETAKEYGGERLTFSLKPGDTLYLTEAENT